MKQLEGAPTQKTLASLSGLLTGLRNASACSVKSHVFPTNLRSVSSVSTTLAVSLSFLNVEFPQRFPVPSFAALRCAVLVWCGELS